MSRDAHRELVRALTNYLGPIDVLTESTRDWSSATFMGMQHVLTFETTATAALIDALCDIDLPMSGHFVADVGMLGAVASANKTQVMIEVLTIRDE